jgi:predicted phosphatase
MEYGININEFEELLKSTIVEKHLPYDADLIMGEVIRVIEVDRRLTEKHMRIIYLPDGKKFTIVFERVQGNLIIRNVGFDEGPKVFRGLDTRIN